MDMGKWKVYGKSIVMVGALVAITVRTAWLGDRHISSGELVQIVIAAATAFNVWLVPNLPQWPKLKATTIGVLTVASIVATTATDWHVSGDEWFNLAIAVGAAVLGIAAPSRSLVSLRDHGLDRPPPPRMR
jgi:hypothetical protein